MKEAFIKLSNSLVSRQDSILAPLPTKNRASQLYRLNFATDCAIFHTAYEKRR